MIPEPYELVLLALIAYRVWRFIAVDTVFEKVRHKLVRLPKTWVEGQSLPKSYRNGLAEFLNCPWCAGLWVAGIVYVLWICTLGEWPDSVTDIAVGLGIWLALSALVGFQRSILDPPEEE
jgi:hypothetical protein